MCSGGFISVIMMIVIVTEEMIGTLSERWISVNSLGFAEKVTHPPTHPGSPRHGLVTSSPDDDRRADSSSGSKIRVPKPSESLREVRLIIAVFYVLVTLV